MDRVQHQAFSKVYGKIWDLAMIEVSVEAISSLTHYYDQSLRCFTFGDFQLAPTIEEFEGILECPIGGRKSYLFSGNGVAGIPRKCLEEKAEALASQGERASFIDILALLVFGTILFSNVDGLMDLAIIDAFLAYHHRKESPVVAVLAYAYDTFDLRCEKSRITWLPKLKSLSGEEAEMPEESEEVQALKAELIKTRVVKEKLKVPVTRVRKECDELKDINMTMVEALEREMKKARKEE
ncbi:hypothetical protein HKD37_02G004360 [Glycine soja]